VVGQGGTTRATRANSGSLGAGSRAGPIAGCPHIGEAGRGSAAEGRQLVIGSRAGPVTVSSSYSAMWQSDNIRWSGR
jgi:hypothetical protein